jgi:LPS-assembly protein
MLETFLHTQKPRSWMLIVISMMVLAFVCLVALPSHAEEQKDQYLLSANEIHNDDPNGIVFASGDVEVDNDGQILKAKSVEFRQKEKTVSASGDVSLISKDGTVLFAKETKLTDDFNDGTASNVSMRLTDNSRFAARDARRVNAHYMIYNKGMFSPCNLCVSNPRKAPLWQVKAAKVTHDTKSKDLIYRDATLEMWGMPVFYTPFMSHPDPTVKRRQGLLNSRYSRSPDLGINITTPYYFDIAPDMDYTFKPNFNGEDTVRLAGTLRKRFEHGDIKFDHSIVVADRLDDDGTTKTNQIRGHVAGYARFDLGNVFRTGADFALLTDKNYLRRYSESYEDILTNRVYLEGFKGRHFGALEMLYFQDNRPGSRPEQPLAFPRFRFSALGEPNETFGGRWSFKGDAVMLNRATEQNTRKIGADFGWERRDILPFGLVSNLKASVRDDVYWVDNLPSPTTPGLFYNGDVSNRFIPQGQVTVSYPLAAYAKSFTHTFEPIIALSASPTLNANPRIPNEDSVDLDFDTSNLFEMNHYSGSDLQEQGIRTSYGFKTGFYRHAGGHGEFTFGQSYRITDDPNFTKGSGLDTRLSDYVGQLKLEPADWFSLNYQFRLDRDKLKSRRHELATNFGVPEFRPRMTYTYGDPSISVPNAANRVEELRYGFSSAFIDYWNLSFEQVHDLRSTTDALRTTTLSLGYADECLTSSLSFSRDHTVRTGVKNGDTYFFRIYFKNLGGIDSTQ